MDIGLLNPNRNTPRVSWPLLAMKLCIVAASARGQNLLSNPSFEFPALASGTHAGFVTGQTIGTGWQVELSGSSTIELNHDMYPGSGEAWPQGSHADQYVFLGRSGALCKMYQDVYLVGGRSYRLDYLMATLGERAGPFRGDAYLNLKLKRLDTSIDAVSQISSLVFDPANPGLFQNESLQFSCPASGFYRLSLDNVASGVLVFVDNFDLNVAASVPQVVRAVPVAGVSPLNAQALSRDGSTIVGWDTVVSGGQSHVAAFLSLGDHAEHVGHLGGNEALAYAVSANGGVVVGQSTNSSGVYDAFRWTPATGIQSIGTLGGRSQAYGVSDDGNVVAGYSAISPTEYHAWRWTPQAGMQDLGIGVAYGVSGDGRVITGPGGGYPHAFRWTPETGMQDIGNLGGLTYGFAANLDGSVITGYGFLSGDQHPFHAFRWTAAGGMVDLGTLGSLSTLPNAISSDGNVIVGTANNFDTGYKEPFVWTPTTGIVSLATFVASRGVTPEPGWTFQSATGVSGDGRTILGNGTYNGQQRAFTIKVPPSNPILAHPQSVYYYSSGPTAPVTYAVRLVEEFASSPIHWFVQSSAEPGEWVELVADGVAHDGLVYTGVHSTSLQVNRGPNGWRRGQYCCRIDTSYGPYFSQAAALSFPLLSVQGGVMQMNANISLIKEYTDGRQYELNRAANSGSVTVPPSSTQYSNGGPRGGGQTGGGIVPGGPRINGSVSFFCGAQLDDSPDQSATLLMTFSASNGFGSYGFFDGADFSGTYRIVEEHGLAASGRIDYVNNVTGHGEALVSTGLGTFSATVVEGAPAGIASASANPVMQGRPTVLTVAVAPGIGPASTGLSVTFDVASLGLVSPLILRDDGAAPDAVAGDNIYTAILIPEQTGLQELLFTVSDWQGRSTTGSLALQVDSAASTRVLPNPVFEGAPATIWVDVNPSAFPTHEQISVTANASAIGGSVALPLRDDGVAPDAVAGDYRFSASVPRIVRASPSQSVYVEVSDGTGYMVNTGSYVSITSGATGSASPSRVAEGELTQLKVQISPQSFPDHSTIIASASATSLGGPADVALLDDGIAPDEFAGDYVFTATVRARVAQGHYTLPFWVGDTSGRFNSGSIAIEVTPSAAGACCALDGTCSLTRQYLCQSSGGVFRGPGTDCGVNYTLVEGETPFEDISGTGLPLELGWNGRAEIPLPFTFNYLGTDYTSMFVSGNGYAQFGSYNSFTGANVPLPSASAPANMICPLWDAYGSFANHLFMLTEGLAGNRRFVISWQNLPQSGVYYISSSFQLVLFEQSGNFEFRYGDLVDPRYGLSGDDYDSGWDSNGATIGFQNATGTVGAWRDGLIAYFGATSGPFSYLGVRTGSVSCSPCPGDLNHDGLVEDSDFVIFAAAYDRLLCIDAIMPVGCPADLNRDAAVDDTDFVLFAAAYDQLLCP